MSKPRPSFSPAHRWKIGLDVCVRTLLALAVVAMVNYLGGKFSHRFYLSAQTNLTLSPRTINILNALTNRVTATLYFDRHADFYPEILALLNEYHDRNPKFSVRTVDYLSDAGAAEKIKEQYHLDASSDKDLIIFDAGGGRVKMFSAHNLLEYGIKGMTPDKKLDIRPINFNGEMIFSAMLLALENSQEIKAYFLQGDGEPSLEDTGNFGYLKFGTVLAENSLTVTNLKLSGVAAVPMDCALLVIAGPKTEFKEDDLQKIDSYLREGGRLLMLFNYFSLQHATGLEPILQAQGVNVLGDVVQDPARVKTEGSSDLIVSKYGGHSIVNALAQVQLQIILPRPVAKVNWQTPPANPPQVDELFFSDDDCVLAADRAEPPRSYPLACAAEQKPVAGAANARGVSRMVVVGDSLFLGNYAIDAGGNRDFLNGALNWLIDRPQLVSGIGPRPVTEYRLLLSASQEIKLRWLLLGALPGGILIFGWLVWFVRRK